MNEFFKKNYFNIILFVLIFIISFCYTYFISFLQLDEIWNYGFSYNISCGLVPYRDFNMLQTPLVFFIGGLFIKIFGNHLWNVHIFNCLIIASMMLVIRKRIGNKAFIMYPIILIYSVFSYNLFCLFLGILILNILDSDYKYKDYLIALLVSLVFLSKQNIGICLFIPMMIYSKKRWKSFIVFLIPNLIFLIYLIFNNALYDFINYAFLGMFDFGNSNGVYYFIVFYIALVLYLVYTLVKSRFKDKNIFYLLMFQVVGYPIVDDYHFMIGFMLVLYYLFVTKKIEKYKYKYLFILSVAFFTVYLGNAQTKLDDYDLGNIHLYSDKKSFLYGRNFHTESEKLLKRLSSYVSNSEDVYDNLYVFNNWAYLVRLNMGVNPNRYDYILNGNMGYKGSEKLIKDVDNNCSKKSCLFIVQLGGNQINFNIIKYVVENYDKIDEIKDIKHSKKQKVNSNYLVYDNLNLLK